LGVNAIHGMAMQDLMVDPFFPTSGKSH